MRLFVVYTDSHSAFYKNLVFADSEAAAKTIVNTALDHNFPSPYNYMTDEEREYLYKQAGLEVPEEIKNSKCKYKITSVEEVKNAGIVHSDPYYY